MRELVISPFYVPNAAGQLKSATDDNLTNSTTSENDYVYDLLGEVTSNTQTIPGLAPTVGFTSTYIDGNRAQMVAKIGSEGTEGTAAYDFVNSYTYGGVLGQMNGISQQAYSGSVPTGDTVDAVAGNAASFGYDLQGEFTTVDRYAVIDGGTALVASAAYGYDAQGNITSLVYSHSGSTLPSYAWTYDSLGDMSTATETLGSIVNSVDYTSDSTGQVLSSTGGPSNESFEYDPNGNSAKSGVVIGLDNEILFDGTYNYAYDAQGNQTARWVQSSANRAAGLLVPACGDSDITYYSWDNLNRMVVMIHLDNFGGGADLPVSFVYDAFNRLVSETATDGYGNTTQKRFAYDGNQIVMQFSGTGTDALTASNLSDRYLWGPAVDQLMADEKVSGLTSAGTVHFALTDNQNSVRDLASYDSGTNATTVVDHRVFSTYGKMLSETNPATLDPATVDCIFGYTGKYADAATGLQWNLNRWYNPSLQTWMSQDPMGFAAGDANLYRYIGNGPTDATDPTGQNRWSMVSPIGHKYILVEVWNPNHTQVVDYLQLHFSIMGHELIPGSPPNCDFAESSWSSDATQDTELIDEWKKLREYDKQHRLLIPIEYFGHGTCIGETNSNIDFGGQAANGNPNPATKGQNRITIVKGAIGVPIVFGNPITPSPRPPTVVAPPTVK